MKFLSNIKLMESHEMRLVSSSIVAIVILALVCTAFGNDRESFAGQWTGQWSNSLGERGDDSLVLKEDSNGKLSGVWTNEVAVSGRRINRNTIELQGQTGTRSYQITATVIGNEMVMQYLSTRLNSSGSYNGTSRLICN
jgi:hypothetical protein